MLTLKNITKTYPGVVALDDVSFSVADGEVHALLGENGAGKSTLIKAIAGAIEPDSGIMAFDDREFKKMTPASSREEGVAVIYQELNLCLPLTVAENIFLGRPQAKLYSQKQVNKLAQEIFDEYGFNLNPGVPVVSLSPAQQQLVEICKGISNNAKIMIMDEPTSALATTEVDLLFNVIRKLKEKGVTVIYISHRLDEVFEITDRITVLRDGKFVATINTADTNRQELVKLMVGRELDQSHPTRSHPLGEVALECRNLTGNSVENISFNIRKGEVLGMAGLVGCGRTETAQLICGAAHIESGEVFVNGKKIKIKSPTDAINAGIGLIPEDRKEQGCILFNTVLFNTTLICNKKYMTAGILSGRKRRAVAQEYKDNLRIKVPSLNQMVINLSGGNQQKVVVAKTMAADLDIIFFDEPTKGIDVGAKQEIYLLMNKMAAEGKAIIMITSDMEELLGMSDRILVLSEGRVAGELTKDRFTQENVLTLASGMEVTA
ncbi:MAG: sugar ABC transporter ATP-binding protein [Ruminococcaceae bacterium]|nr:sugar ABC transporter ATP-binding protein [Oscillospiraceae bacterium]